MDNRGLEVRVKFELDVVEGFPPIGAEILIGAMEDSGLVRVDNTPFFVEGVAIGDMIKCAGRPPELDFVELIEPSGNKSVSIIFIDSGYENILYNQLKGKGCYCEFGEFPEFNMLAISIDSKIAYRPIRELLDEAESAGRISFAELCIA
ncbi:MAG: DUF4265 domain-containing protein [Pseudomonadota bacterium]|nr:DUF4265 domain-containing protein [Pseudomonadota bacterium]